MNDNRYDIFDGFFNGKRVLITGHTGFKGAWLTLWLKQLGADVSGIALDPNSERDLFNLCNIHDMLGENDIRADIRDADAMREIFDKVKPEIVFHLAAQPLVRLSYEKPLETYETNVMGTINVLEAIRHTDSVKVGVMITTDKCYENKEQFWGYRETDAMGGYDPYSSSKGAAEIAIASWRRSYFNPDKYAEHGKSIASVRAGNVIGGGDWAADRIIPDIYRALEKGEVVEIRSPHAVRPWEHVLEPLSGYMLLAKKMLENPTEYCEGWNFGPTNDSVADVWTIASYLAPNSIRDVSDPNALHEANLLMLDISKAKYRLGWTPTWNLARTLRMVSEWYNNYQKSDVKQLTLEQIKEFTGNAVDKNAI